MPARRRCGIWTASSHSFCTTCLQVQHALDACFQFCLRHKRCGCGVLLPCQRMSEQDRSNRSSAVVVRSHAEFTYAAVLLFVRPICWRCFAGLPRTSNSLEKHSIRSCCWWLTTACSLDLQSKRSTMHELPPMGTRELRQLPIANFMAGEYSSVILWSIRKCRHKAAAVVEDPAGPARSGGATCGVSVPQRSRQQLLWPCRGCGTGHSMVDSCKCQMKFI